MSSVLGLLAYSLYLNCMHDIIPKQALILAYQYSMFLQQVQVLKIVYFKYVIYPTSGDSDLASVHFYQFQFNSYSHVLIKDQFKFNSILILQKRINPNSVKLIFNQLKFILQIQLTVHTSIELNLPFNFNSICFD